MKGVAIPEVGAKMGAFPGELQGVEAQTISVGEERVQGPLNFDQVGAAMKTTGCRIRWHRVVPGAVRIQEGVGERHNLEEGQEVGLRSLHYLHHYHPIDPGAAVLPFLEAGVAYSTLHPKEAAWFQEVGVGELPNSNCYQIHPVEEAGRSLDPDHPGPSKAWGVWEVRTFWALDYFSRLACPPWDCRPRVVRVLRLTQP